jgi:hypothetical protein
MPNLPLYIRESLTAIGLIPAPVQVLGHHPKLDNEIARKVLGLDFAPLSRQRRKRAASSLPMVIRASEPPMK